MLAAAVETFGAAICQMPPAPQRTLSPCAHPFPPYHQLVPHSTSHRSALQLGPLFTVGVLVGLVGLVGCLSLFYIAIAALRYSPQDPRMRTFCFELIFFFCATNVFVTRERRWFWSSRPGWPLLFFVVIDSIVAVVLATVGTPEMPAIPIADSFIIVVWSLLVGLFIGDAVKVAYYSSCGCVLLRNNSRRTCYRCCGCTCGSPLPEGEARRRRRGHGRADDEDHGPNSAGEGGRVKKSVSWAARSGEGSHGDAAGGHHAPAGRGDAESGDAHDDATTALLKRQ